MVTFRPGNRVSFGLARGKDRHVFRQRQLAADLAFGVVVAVDHINGNVALAQPRHLLDEEQPGIEVAPVAVIDIAGDNDEIDRFGLRQIDHPLQGPARRPAQQIDRRAIIGRKADQRAVEMDIGGVDEFHGCLGPIQLLAVQYDR